MDNLIDLATLLTLDLRLGDCVVDIIKDKIDNFYILDVSINLEEELIAKILGYDYYSRFVWDCLKNAGIKGRVKRKQILGEITLKQILDLNYNGLI